MRRNVSDEKYEANGTQVSRQIAIIESTSNTNTCVLKSRTTVLFYVITVMLKVTFALVPRAACVERRAQHRPAGERSRRTARPDGALFANAHV